MLKKMLLALAAPKHVAATEGAGVERRPGPERMGRAFRELIERIAAKDLPKVGGRDATIVVTIDLDTLLGRLQKAGVLDTGERISPAEARRLACTARIIPVVLGGTTPRSSTSDRRNGSSPEPRPPPWASATKAASPRAATGHPGCATPTTGPDGPTADRPTSTNGGLLCPRHHARAHDPTYEMTHHPDGKVTFHRRP